MTPCEFEHRAGCSSSKNWKRTICCVKKPIGAFLEGFVNCVGKKEAHFVAESLPLSSLKTAETASTFFVSAVCGFFGFFG